MKKLFLISILLLLQSCDIAFAQTPTGNIVPMATGEKMIGRWTDRWKVICADSLNLTYGLNPTMIGWTSSYRTVTDAQISGWNGLVTFPGFGTSGSTACVGNDGRLSDSRIASDVYAWAKASVKPSYTYSEVGASASSHTHGNMASNGSIGSTANLPIITTTSGVLTTGSFGTGANTFCQGNDGRLSDARTPLTHSHAESDVTNLTTDLGNKQATLVSGTTIKTVNGNTLLGSGDIAISGSAAWGSITGTLSSQTDLSSALTGKQQAYSILTALGGLANSTGYLYNNGAGVLSYGTPSFSATWGAISGTLSNQTDLNSALSGKQATLVSGTNIKTINGTTILGSGDLVVSGSGGLGYCLNVQAASQSTTTDAQTLYWGGMLVAPSTTANRWRVYIPKAGTIKAVYIYSYATTAGTGEAWVMNIRKNNTTDTQIASVATATVDRIWSNTALSISVVAGDYIEIKEVCPTWATNPATVTRTGQIYVE